VAFICIFIAKWLNFEEEQLKAILQAGLLHDVGKCRISDRILNKPSSLTEDEFNQMKKHPVFGYNILEKVSEVRQTTALAALEHHEKINGKGYPLGLTDNKIHLYGKITAIADIFDAMTSNRVYHKKSSPFQVFSTLEDLMYGSLDPQLVLVFLKNLAGYYIGDRVKLSDGAEGVVVYINPRSISKPVIQTNDGLMNLEERPFNELYISDIL
jgi:HD-GYP domain-containing protein (c-di-GMP phosphodiesterase class II)